MKNIFFYTIIVFLSFFIISFILKSSKNKINDNNDFDSYYVNFSPCGEVEFKSVPKKIVSGQETYNDILMSFNISNNIIGMTSKDKFYFNFYEDLNLQNYPNFQNMQQISIGRNLYDKEIFYSINANIHHIDPVTLSMTKGWSESDIIEISRNIGPFFGNRYSIENKKPQHIKNYKFYSLDEINLKFGEVYKQKSKAEKINNFTNQLIDLISSKLKNVSGKKIAIIYLCKKGIVPFDISSDGYGFSQYRILKCIDSFKISGIRTYSYEGNLGIMLDKESLLMANPDVIIINEGIYIDNRYNFFSRRTILLQNELEKWKNDPLLKDLTAFKNNQIILGGIYDQGPIARIYQLEMLAKQLYPEIFGKFNSNHKYPENEQLFSRKELRDIILNE